MAACLYALAVWTPVGAHLDSSLMGAGLIIGSPSPYGPWRVLREGGILVLALALIVVSVPELRRGRWRRVTTCLVFVVVTSLTATVLRRLLARPDLGDPTYPFNTWPSGHAAASVAMVVALVVLVTGDGPLTSRRQRIVVAALVVICGASVATQSHRPSDVVGGMLIAGGFTALFVHPRPGAPVDAHGRRTLALTVGAAIATLGFVALRTAVLGGVANLAWIGAAALTVSRVMTSPSPMENGVTPGRASRPRS